MTEEEFQKDIEWAIKRAEELRRQLEAGEIELPLAPTSENGIRVWPLIEWSIDPTPYGLIANPVNMYLGKSLTIFSPMEYSHDDKDKGTE